MEAQHHSFLTSGLDGSKWSASRHGRVTPEEGNTKPTQKKINPRTYISNTFRYREFIGEHSEIKREIHITRIVRECHLRISRRTTSSRGAGSEVQCGVLAPLGISTFNNSLNQPIKNLQKQN